MPPRPLLTLLALATIAMTGCDAGAPIERGAGSCPPASPLDDYFPLETGAEWAFDVTRSSRVELADGYLHQKDQGILTLRLDDVTCERRTRRSTLTFQFRGLRTTRHGGHEQDTTFAIEESWPATMAMESEENVVAFTLPTTPEQITLELPRFGQAEDGQLRYWDKRLNSSRDHAEWGIDRSKDRGITRAYSLRENNLDRWSEEWTRR